MKTVNNLLCEIKALRRRRDDALTACQQEAEQLLAGITAAVRGGTAAPEEDRKRLDELQHHLAGLEVAADKLDKATNKLLGIEVPPELDNKLEWLLRGTHDIVFQAAPRITPPY